MHRIFLSWAVGASGVAPAARLRRRARRPSARHEPELLAPRGCLRFRDRTQAIVLELSLARRLVQIVRFAAPERPSWARTARSR